MNINFNFVHNLHIFIISIFFACTHFVQAKVVVPDNILYRKPDLTMLHNRFPQWTEGCDTVFATYENIKLFFYNADSIFRHIATQNADSVMYERWLFRYFMDVCRDEKRFERDRKKLVAIIQEYKNAGNERAVQQLETELDMFDVYTHWDGGTPMTLDKWNYFMKMIKKYEHRGDFDTELCIRYRVMSCVNSATFVSERLDKERLSLVGFIDECLAAVERNGGNDYMLEPAFFFYTIGKLYFEFAYYDKAQAMFERAAATDNKYYWNLYPMKARDYLGACYQMKGDYEQADRVYFSMLQNIAPMVRRPVFEAVALGNLAKNRMEQGDSKEAMRLFPVAIERALQAEDSTLAADFALHLANIYLQNDSVRTAVKTHNYASLQNAALLIENAKKWLTAGGLPLRNWDRYYQTSSNYYLKTGNAAMAAQALDSLAKIQKAMQQVFDPHILAFAEQEAFETEKELKNKIIGKNRILLGLSIAVIAGAVCFLVYLIISYRKKIKTIHRRYQEIKEQNRLYAELEKMKEDAEYAIETQCTTAQQSPTDKHKNQHEKLHAEMRSLFHEKKIYHNANLTRESFFAMLDVSKAVAEKIFAKYAQMSFADYLVDLRLRESIALLETSRLTIEKISESVGFGSVRTFQRNFLAKYQITPKEYRNAAFGWY